MDSCSSCNHHPNSERCDLVSHPMSLCNRLPVVSLDFDIQPYYLSYPFGQNELSLRAVAGYNVPIVYAYDRFDEDLDAVSSLLDQNLAFF